jgi:zinc D-Ala-D-Ala carboxypeptidase
MTKKTKDGHTQGKKVGIIVGIVLAFFLLAYGVLKLIQRMYKPKNTDFWSSVKYFIPEEFDSPDEKGSGHKMQPELIFKLDAARESAGVPFRVNSGYRTGFWNAKKGGVKSSEHMIGKAADIDFNDHRDFWRIFEALDEEFPVRMGLYFDNRDKSKIKSFIHVGISKTHPQTNWAEWNGKKVSKATFLKNMQSLA